MLEDSGFEIVPPGGIDAVLFDAGGVLLLPSPDGLRTTLAPFGATPDDERCRWGHYVSTRAVDRLGTNDWRPVDRVVAAELGVPKDQLDAASGAIDTCYMEGGWVPIAGAAEAMLKLQHAGFPLAVVSNAGGTMEALLAEHRICSVLGGETAEVAIVVDSAVVGVEKPDPAIFGFALEALDLPADRCLYVGDTVRFDVDGARAAGLYPLHLDPYQACTIDGHAHVQDLDQLVATLVNHR